MTVTSSSKVFPWLDEIPSDWQADRLKDVVPRIVGGGTPSISNPEFWDGDVVWVTPTDFSNAPDRIELSTSERKITIDGLESSSAVLVPAGTVIMCSRASIGAVRIAATELATNQGFISFVCNEGRLHNRFLYYAIDGYLGPFFAEIAPRTTFAEISRGKAKQEVVAFPSNVGEQRRIARYLDARCAEIDRAILLKNDQLRTLASIRASIVESAVTRGIKGARAMTRIQRDWIYELPADWNCVRIKRLAARIDYGISESTEPTGQYPVLKMGNIQDGEIALSKMEFVAEVSPDLILERNDLLYNRTNSADQVGKAALFRLGREAGYTFASYLVRIRVNHRILPEYLNFVVGCDAFLSFARRLAIPSVQQSNLNSTRYGRMLVPLPPLDEQVAICAHLNSELDALSRVVTATEQQVATLQRCRTSLIHDCVTGKRRVSQDSADAHSVDA